MRGLNMPREFYIPQGAAKIADKQSSAVAYVYTTKQGQPGAVAFHGKASKPDWKYRFRSEAERAKYIAGHFEKWRAIEGERKERREKAKAFEHPYKVGDLFRSSWGYDQTNVDYYEVVAVSGKMLTVREIAQKAVETGFMSGRCVPLPGAFTGEPIRCKAQDGHIKIDHYRHAYFEPGKLVAGVRVYDSSYYSSYA